MLFKTNPLLFVIYLILPIPCALFSAATSSSQAVIDHEKISEEKARKIYEIYESELRGKSSTELTELLAKTSPRWYARTHEDRLRTLALLYAGADPSAGWYIPFEKAVKYNDYPITEFFLKKGADPNCWIPNARAHEHPLIYKCKTKKMLTLFLNYGAKIQAKIREPIGYFAKNQPVLQSFIIYFTHANYSWAELPGIVLSLIQAGAQVNQPDSYGMTPLLYAVSEYDFHHDEQKYNEVDCLARLIRFFLRSGADTHWRGTPPYRGIGTKSAPEILRYYVNRDALQPVKFHTYSSSNIKKIIKLAEYIEHYPLKFSEEYRFWSCYSALP